MLKFQILCSPCWDKSGAANVEGCFPRAICERCGELHMGYGASVPDEPQAADAVARGVDVQHEPTPRA